MTIGDAMVYIFNGCVILLVVYFGLWLVAGKSE